MKTIGLLGGMSWESSIEYYRIINEEIKHRLGGTYSAKIIMNSVNFHEIEVLQHNSEWEQLTNLMIEESKKLELAGADFLVICTNTMHKMANELQKNLSIPLLHIADATAKLVKDKDIQEIGLLGTKFTMEEEFYKGRLENMHKLNVILPNLDERNEIHRIIYDELVLGTINYQSKEIYKDAISNLEKNGAQGVILGCTEIGLLIKPSDTNLPTFDTTFIHSIAAVDMALEGYVL
ncbi:MAG: aspartate/glutamate racemase family protein [Candidatus Heimdallarchaeota archaeon]|nr:aspartate/glutamate racemase family protein [Candidatus Heimdallarchaeota archaeon]